MSVGDNIKNTRIKQGITQEELANKIGTTKQTIYKYENGIVTNIPLSKLEVIADALGVTTAHLMGWEEPKHLTIPGAFVPKMRRVPLLGKTACGQPIYSPNFDNGFALINSDIPADFALEAQGESMSGVGIHSGDVIFFVAADMVDNGQIAAVVVGEEVTLKRVYYYPNNNKLILNSENPAFEPLVYIGSELDEIRIIGRARAQLRKL